MADIDKLFEQISNEVLTEDVKLQMSVLFENALTEAVKAKEVELEKQNKTEIAEFKEGMITKIDDYLGLFVEEFVSKNSSVIEDSVKVKTAEKILKTFNGIVNDFHVQLDEKVATDEEALKESKEEINKLTKKLIESRKEVKMREKAAIVMEAASKFDTELEKAKLVEFAKKLPFDELFEKKLGAYCKTTLTESKKPATEPKKEKLVIKEEKEEFVKEPVKETVINRYVENL